MANNIPYIGSKISLITTSDIRYEGILYTLNREESTIAVQNVRSFGTEGRRCPEIPMSNEIYDFIIFRGKDLKDLTVIQGTPDRPSAPSYGPGGDAYGGDCQGPTALYTAPAAPSPAAATESYRGGLQAGAGAAQASSVPSAYGRPSAVASTAAPRNGYAAAAPAPAGLELPYGGAYASPASCASRPAVESQPPAAAAPSPYGGVAAAAVPASRSPWPASADTHSAPVVAGGVSARAPGLAAYGAEEVAAAMPVQRGTAQEASAEARSSAEAKERQSAVAAATVAAAEPKAKQEAAAGAARGRGKGGAAVKKTLAEVLRSNPRANELITTKMRGMNSSNLQPADLRAMSEMNHSVYHFYLDFLNFVCTAHGVQSDEQQWESLSKALKKHFEKEFGAGSAQKAPQPQRPNNTLGDFITIETKASKKGSKMPARGAGGPGGPGAVGPAPGAGGAGGRVGRGPGRDIYKKEDGNHVDVDVPSNVEDSGSQASSWVCPRCTLRNENILLECAACGTSKQQAALWAEFPPLG